MRHNTCWTMTGILAISVFCVPMAKAQVSTTASPLVSHYAEDMYQEYSVGSSGKISFEVETVNTSSLSTIAGLPFSSLLTVPSYRILTDQTGTILLNPRFVAPEDPSYGQQDLQYTADKFADYGLPLEDGSYRQLVVTATINGDVRSHEALEFCWAALDHCTVLDPVVVFLQSKVDVRRSLAAEGWGPRVTHQALTSNAIAAASGTCGLASHHNWTGETETWSAYSVPFKDIFGITLFTLYLSKQIDGISCTTSCKPLPFLTSNASSASSFPGYSTACGNKGASGVTGSTARAIAETYCTEKFAGSASVSVSVKGSGASVSLSWSLGGSAFSNGGILTDSCGKF